jgi:hypothetical protein
MQGPLALVRHGRASRIDFANDAAGRDNVGTSIAALRLAERLEAPFPPSARFETRIGAHLDAFVTRLRGSAPSLAELPGIPAPGPPSTSIALSENLLQLGFAPYLEQVWRPGRFELTLGGRAEFLRCGDIATWSPEPRSVVRFQVVLHGVWLKAGSGRFSQAPLPFQVLREGGNPAVRPNRALQNSFGAELKLAAACELDSTVFYKAMWQLTRAPPRLTVDAAGDVKRALYADDGRGQACGFELLLRRRVSQGCSDGCPIHSAAASASWKVASTSCSRSIRRAQSGAQLPHGGFRYGARFTLATGRPVTDLLDPSGKKRGVRRGWRRLQPELGRPLRTAADVSATRRAGNRDFRWGPFTGSIYIDIINVYNAHNSEAYQYQFDFSTRGVLPGLPFLSTLGLRGVLR